MKKMMINWQNMKSELFVSKNGAKPKPKKLFLRIGYWKINLIWRHWSKALVIGLIWTWISSKKKSQMWLMKLCIFWKAENSFGNKLDWDKANIEIRFFSLSISHRIVREREKTRRSFRFWVYTCEIRIDENDASSYELCSLLSRERTKKVFLCWMKTWSNILLHPTKSCNSVISIFTRKLVLDILTVARSARIHLKFDTWRQ